MKTFFSIIILGLSLFFIHFSASAEESEIQTWIDKGDNIKIHFSYIPKYPIIDTFTKLKFDVVDLSNKSYNGFDARVTVTNGQRLFHFNNLTSSNGSISVEYIFPDDGTHQVIFRLDTNTSIEVASFDVFVPHQQNPGLLFPFQISDRFILMGIVFLSGTIIVFLILILIYIRKRKNTYKL